jgi:CSLREA domain-containing protein
VAGDRKLLGALVAALLLFAPVTASANTIVPDTRADEPGLDPDNGNCTLREAIESADQDVSEDACRRGNGADVIKLRRGTYELSVPGVEAPGSTEIDNNYGDLDVGVVGTSPLKIVGHKRGTTVDGNDHDRVFQVWSVGTTTFDRLTITDGAAVNRGGGVSVIDDSKARFKRTRITQSTASDGDGGVSVLPGAQATFDRVSIRENAVPSGRVGGGLGVFGRAELDRTRVTGNEAELGGGVFVYTDFAPDPAGVAILKRSRISQNDAFLRGGGIATGADSRLTLSQSTVDRNDAVGSGGGIHIDRGSLVVNATTLAGNEAGQEGGGISGAGDPSAPISMRVTNSTITGNVAGAEGGGISAGTFGQKKIVSSTITDNEAERGGGILGPFVTTNLPVELKGTIVAGNTARSPNPTNGPDCLFLTSESGMSLGHNLIGTDNGCDFGERGSDLGGNAGLEPLRSNGGPTKTHALRRSSRAIDEGPPDAPRKDQRGVRRRDPDIGSYER